MRQIAFSLTVLSLLCLGCGGETKSGKGGGKSSKGKGSSEIAGKILIQGSSTVEPISNQAKEQFNRDFPNVEISVGGEGTSNGFKAFVKNETDISDASRPIKQKELDICNKENVEFIEIPVAYDGLTFAINKKNTAVTELTVEQLKKIFVEDGVTSWKQLDDSFPDKPIKIFMPGTGSGTYDYAYEILAKKSEKKLRNEAEIVTMSEQDNILVDGVKGDEFAIGFFGFAYYEANKNDLKAVKIVNPSSSKAVAPTMETIESGSYAPFSRPLFIYVNKTSLSKLQVRKFVEFYVDNAKKLAVDAKYVALPEEMYKLAKANLENQVVGTHFLDENGEKRSGGLIDVFKKDNLKK